MKGRFVRKYRIHTPYKGVVKSLRYNTARTILRSSALHKPTITEISRAVKEECEKLCKTKPFPSKFRVKRTRDLVDMDWVSMQLEINRVAPVLTSVLTAAGSNPDPAFLCMICGILLKSRCKHMCKVQMLVSTILYAGHASKKVRIFSLPFKRNHIL